MTSRRIAAFLLLVCLLAPAAQARDLEETFSWLPQWLLNLIGQIHDTLATEIPTNATDHAVPVVPPTG